MVVEEKMETDTGRLPNTNDLHLNLSGHIFSYVCHTSEEKGSERRTAWSNMTHFLGQQKEHKTDSTGCWDMKTDPPPSQKK